MRQYSLEQTADIVRRRTRLAAQGAFMHGAPQQTFTVSATRFFPIRNRLRNIGPLRHCLVRLFLSGHSVANAGRPTITFMSI
jgi:hypothetical protein